ncbi:carbohydrate sulfotransferase 13-like [Penaeus japonicus]|uniref:carbohydrate sulfotransferase 13-like n=1 Tax=Penaeus japonicus TaxID=27405 RepID=UPI001C714525|nr:carbohydrate sulfotransferase 13-like [Penaeus japonicus]
MEDAGTTLQEAPELNAEAPNVKRAFNGKPKDGRWASEMEAIRRESVDLERVGNILRERQSTIREGCVRSLSPAELSEEPNSKEFLINREYKLVWCNVFKAASSTWLYNFLLLAGVSEKVIRQSRSSPVEVARKEAYPRPSVGELRSALTTANYTSFLIVRDPFQRLLSAYRDKIEATRQIYYRRTYLPRVTRDCQPTFPEFVDYLLEERAKGRPPNEHWAPYHAFCSPCQVHFDYVLRFESLPEEEAFLIETVAGLSNVLQPCKLHSSHTDYIAVTKHYFSQLSQEKLRRLYDIYKPDFDIFGYDETPYFDEI